MTNPHIPEPHTAWNDGGINLLAEALQAFSDVLTINADGSVTILVPTEDPGVAGTLWNDSGTLSVSAG